jgi:coenzyme F420-reducing hydrogenase alpha subunit
VPVEPVAGVGCGATEAPRGLLYHRYEISDEGTILDAKIVPPTSQNQLAIEDDLRDVVGRYAERSDDELRNLCEQTIRNYDPCISCATHFLTLEVERT